MHHSWWTLIQAGLFLTNKGTESVGLLMLDLFLKINSYPVCGVRQPRNLGHEDSVDLTLQSADYKVRGFLFLTHLPSISLCPIKMTKRSDHCWDHFCDQRADQTGLTPRKTGAMVGLHLGMTSGVIGLSFLHNHS